jgi:hypothetical protein
MDHQTPAGSSRVEQLVQRTKILERTGVMERTLAVEERPVDVDQEQGEAMPVIAGLPGRH